MRKLILPIKPKWIELIASGRKKIEVRTKLPVRYVKDINDFEPYMVLMYMTMDGVPKTIFKPGKTSFIEKSIYELHPDTANGRVVGEFVVEKIDFIKYNLGGYLINNDIQYSNKIYKQSCLDNGEFRDYFNERNGYAKHISQLKMYDQPKELNSYRRIIKRINKCPDLINIPVTITTAPPSFMYVEGEL